MNKLIFALTIMATSANAEMQLHNITSQIRDDRPISYWAKDGYAQLNTLCFPEKETPEYKDDYLHCLQDARLHFAHECLIHEKKSACEWFKAISQSDDFLKAYWQKTFERMYPNGKPDVEKVSKTKTQTDLD